VFSFEWREKPLAVGNTTALRYEMQDPDVRLMLEVRDDSAAAFEELMLRYQQRLIRVLTHLTGQPEQAEDLAQDVFLRVYRARKKYVPGSKFSTWLFTIANNVALNALRTLSRRREVNIAVAQSGPLSGQPLEQMIQAASGLMPSRQLDRAEMRDVIQAALATLNERQRLAVLLNKFEHMSYTEISAVMGLSEKAIKSLLSRARVNLRQVLEPYLERGEKPK
jgi:RNA polymerase sigma-70 factor (ECF subfamily)